MKFLLNKDKHLFLAVRPDGVVIPFKVDDGESYDDTLHINRDFLDSLGCTGRMYYLPADNGEYNLDEFEDITDDVYRLANSRP